MRRWVAGEVWENIHLALMRKRIVRVYSLSLFLLLKFLNFRGGLGGGDRVAGFLSSGAVRMWWVSSPISLPRM